MRQFVARHAEKITGVLSGFDRLILRGHLLPLAHEGGVRAFLASQGVLLKDFGCYVESTTKAIRVAAAGVLERLGRPIRYLESSRTSKEQVARTLLAEQPMRSGPICMLSAVEPCSSWRVSSPRLDLPLRIVVSVDKQLPGDLDGAPKHKVRELRSGLRQVEPGTSGHGLLDIQPDVGASHPSKVIGAVAVQGRTLGADTIIELDPPGLQRSAVLPNNSPGHSPSDRCLDNDL